MPQHFMPAKINALKVVVSYITLLALKIYSYCYNAFRIGVLYAIITDILEICGDHEGKQFKYKYILKQQQKTIIF